MFKFKKFLFFQPVVEDDVDNKVEAAPFEKEEFKAKMLRRSRK